MDVVVSPPTQDDADQAFAAMRRALERAVATVSPRLPRDQRDDVVQAAILRLLRIQRASEGTREFESSYLWRVAYSALIDETRRRRRRREDPVEPGELDSGSRSQGDPEHHYQGREIGMAIQSCLQRLVRPRRLAVTLYLQGHGVPEASRLMGWPRKRTENLVYRGLADLRRCLDARGVRP